MITKDSAITLFSLGALFLLGGCSGSSAPIDTVNPATSVQVAESATETDTTPVANETVVQSGTPTEFPTDNTEPESTPPEVYEMTPIELLIEEVRLSAGAALLQISNKLAAGLPLSHEEQACLGDYDSATGTYLTSILCNPAVALDNSIMQVRVAEFDITIACETAVSEGNLNDCTLNRASLLIPIEWVPLFDEERIANITPIPGVDITHNIDNSGKLVLKNSSTITVSFECVIDIQSAQVVSELSSGNCVSQIGQTINRLYGLRLSATPPG